MKLKPKRVKAYNENKGRRKLRSILCTDIEDKKISIVILINFFDIGFGANRIVMLSDKYCNFIRLRKKLGILFTDSIGAAISEKTGTREWDKADTPPPTTTLSTLRSSAAIFRRVGICA